MNQLLIDKESFDNACNNGCLSDKYLIINGNRPRSKYPQYAEYGYGVVFVRDDIAERWLNAGIECSAELDKLNDKIKELEEKNKSQSDLISALNRALWIATHESHDDDN